MKILISFLLLTACSNTLKSDDTQNDYYYDVSFKIYTNVKSSNLLGESEIENSLLGYRDITKELHSNDITFLPKKIDLLLDVYCLECIENEKHISVDTSDIIVTIEIISSLPTYGESIVDKLVTEDTLFSGELIESSFKNGNDNLWIKNIDLEKYSNYLESESIGRKIRYLNIKSKIIRNKKEISYCQYFLVN